MTTKINELVERLTKEQAVECSRPAKNAGALKECIDRNYVHVMFLKTETELGVELYLPECNFDNANFEQGTGSITVSGALTLNYNRVKCVATIDLTTCEGKGNLVLLKEEEYKMIMEAALQTAN